MMVQVSYSKYCIAGFLAGIRMDVSYNADANIVRVQDGQCIKDTTGNVYRVENVTVSAIAREN